MIPPFMEMKGCKRQKNVFKNGNIYFSLIQEMKKIPSVWYMTNQMFFEHWNEEN